ncbi:MAG: tachylectin-related carbohydrate-binding protein [Gammaproteobacteria bacterium]
MCPLYWNQHTGYRNGTPEWLSPTLIGTKWAGVKRVFSPAEGVIYAINSRGELVWYRHEGWADGSMRWLGPVKISEGWGDFVHVFPSKWGTDIAETIH